MTDKTFYLVLAAIVFASTLITDTALLISGVSV